VIQGKIVKEDGSVLASSTEFTTSFFERAKGLLGKKVLQPSYALWIHPCNSIHMLFMSVSIDAIFLDSNNVITSIKYRLKPFCLPVIDLKARSVIELPAGTVASHGVGQGEKLSFVAS